MCPDELTESCAFKYHLYAEASKFPSPSQTYIPDYPPDISPGCLKQHIQLNMPASPYSPLLIAQVKNNGGIPDFSLTLHIQSSKSLQQFPQNISSFHHFPPVHCCHLGLLHTSPLSTRLPVAYLIPLQYILNPTPTVIF